MIPYGRQEITEDDIEAVVRVLRSELITQGPAVERFEEALASQCGARRSVAVANGTAALHLACRAAGLSEGGLLWTSPITFVASANCARYCGADVDFIDIEHDTANMDAAALALKLERAETAGRLPDVVIPVHFAGASCDMESIGALAARYGFTVIEDACHAVGGAYQGRPVGSCEHSRAAVFSFHPVKVVTTGEGGAVTTNDAGFAETVALLRAHGITRDERRMEVPSEGPWYYEMVDLGHNYRMTDIQAALGTSQLARIERYVARRNELAERYREELADLPLAPLAVRRDVRSAYHLYAVRIQPDAPVKRAEMFAELRSLGVGVNVHYIPVHLQPYYRRLGFARGDFPEAERYYDEALTLPLYPSMTDDDQRTVVSALRQALER